MHFNYILAVTAVLAAKVFAIQSLHFVNCGEEDYGAVNPNGYSLVVVGLLFPSVS